jgi:hypothetical protein
METARMITTSYTEKVEALDKKGEENKAEF